MLVFSVQSTLCAKQHTQNSYVVRYLHITGKSITISDPFVKEKVKTNEQILHVFKETRLL